MNFRREGEFFTIREEIFHFAKLEPRLDIDGALDRKHVGRLNNLRSFDGGFFSPP